MKIRMQKSIQFDKVELFAILFEFLLFRLLRSVRFFEILKLLLRTVFLRLAFAFPYYHLSLAFFFCDN